MGSSRHECQEVAHALQKAPEVWRAFAQEVMAWLNTLPESLRF